MTIKINLSILLLALAFVVVACTSQQQKSAADVLIEEAVEENIPLEPDTSAVEDEMATEAGRVAGATTTDDVDPLVAVNFSGTVLAGTTSPLLEFNQADYELALKSNKIILLYFYANWCPICKAEFPRMQQAFNQLTGDQVVAFRVNFNDTETTASEEALAKEFGVAYQHTKVAIKNGQRVLKAPDSWDEQRYLAEISKLLTN